MKITKEYKIETVSVDKYNNFIVTGKDSTGKVVYTKSFDRLRDAIKRANEIMLEEFI